MICSQCNHDYPPELLAAMFVNGSYTPRMCGICALALSNALHHDNRKTFAGTMAEASRQAAIRHRARRR
jgi:hypothetical protein